MNKTKVMLDPVDRSTNSIKKRVFSASVWSFFGALVAQATSFLIFVVLARLLTPYEFGLVAFFALFIDLSRGVIVGAFLKP